MNTFVSRLQQSFRIFLIVAAGSFAVHIVTMYVDYISFSEPHPGGITAALYDQLSMHLIPIAVAYSVLFGVICYLWYKYRNEIEQQHEKELQLKRDQTVIETTQQITALMVQYISRYNYDIRDWIESRRDTGKVPERLERANANISKALEALTKISFLIPYMEQNTNYVKYLENSLAELPE